MVKLIVGNLPPSATNQSLKELFHQYEDLQDYKLISNYGFVYLESEESAMHAVYNLNGIEYRGFQVTVDYVGDSRNKRKLPTPTESNQFKKAANPIQYRLPIEQSNQNPYNLSYPNGNNGVTRSYDIPPEKRYDMPQQPTLEARNPNPYNLPVQNSNKNAPRPFNPMTERCAPQPYQEYRDPMYGGPAYANEYERVPAQQFRARVQYQDYTEQYIPEEEYFSNVPPAKRPRAVPFDHADGYGYQPRRPIDFPPNNNRMIKNPQPHWIDGRQMRVGSGFLHPRDEAFYRPKGGNVYQPSKSYIDEYEDDNDYKDVDPYPAYLKQYHKK